jgi:benzoyl-CoA reductase/2-hydroxyglutaryl-CoA dehydratase subunit BcrC/BadD/HgdB
MNIKDSIAGNIPMPDLIFCCNNICNTVIKWYENIAKELGIPMILFDMPFNHTYEVPDHSVKYIRGQFEEAIVKLEAISGEKFDHDRFKEVMAISSETARWWKKATMMATAIPSPLNGFDLFNYMATIVCMRGKQEGLDLFKLWAEELQEKIDNGEGPWKTGEEKYRVMWDGIACWPYLSDTYKTLKNNGINMVTSTYPDSWNIVYESDDVDGMARAYSSNYVNRNLDFGSDNITSIVKDFSLDGIIYHSNRSCKLMDFRQYEVQRKVLERTGIPSVIFDGDQTDPRAFSLAQYETRIQALMEMMKQRKQEMKGE